MVHFQFGVTQALVRYTLSSNSICQTTPMPHPNPTSTLLPSRAVMTVGESITSQLPNTGPRGPKLLRPSTPGRVWALAGSPPWINAEPLDGVTRIAITPQRANATIRSSTRTNPNVRAGPDPLLWPTAVTALEPWPQSGTRTPTSLFRTTPHAKEVGHFKN